MIDLVAWLGVFAGGAVFYQSVKVVTEANAGRRLPYWRRPEVTPRAAIGLRVVGIALVTASAAFLVPALGYSAIAVLVMALLPGLVAIPLHNRRITADE
ncbi:hypothetical protein DY023_12415 [Microbacterium bovistercoris]|uniref:DUF3784 domain-containing protein n=1 Tax=Microbacterium bovistercoris TaxID=2293570 RepID=A0A371NS94_9MICO|nr:hypothetical protein [Microbacterium bovistercoris]REJ05034.1 hypothetical protein DY023_12415 [Microbacterium bovistercoris]